MFVVNFVANRRKYKKSHFGTIAKHGKNSVLFCWFLTFLVYNIPKANTNYQLVMLYW